MKAWLVKFRYVLPWILAVCVVGMAAGDFYTRYRLRNERQLKELQKTAAYNRSVLGRAPRIEADYAAAVKRFAPFLSGDDAATTMSELDTLARSAGARVEIIRPVSDDEVSLVIHGTWPQVTDFLKAAEGEGHLFEFKNVTIQLRQPARELQVSATVSRYHTR